MSNAPLDSRLYRIDAAMKSTKPEVMRLVGTEPHPIHDGTDLFTYACTGCDEFFVVPIETSTHG